MTTSVQPQLVGLKGYTKAEQLTAENLQDFAKSVNGTIEDGIVVFTINKWTHRALVGDWVVVYMPSGDIQVFTDAMFNRIFERQETSNG